MTLILFVLNEGELYWNTLKEYNDYCNVLEGRRIMSIKKYYHDVTVPNCPKCGEDLILDKQPWHWVCITEDCLYQEQNNVTFCRGKNGKCKNLVLSATGKFTSLEEQYCEYSPENEQDKESEEKYIAQTCLDLARLGVEKSVDDQSIGLVCLECHGEIVLNDGFLTCSACGLLIDEKVLLLLDRIRIVHTGKDVTE